MDDYFDKEKFTGGQTPPRQTPPPYPPPPPRHQPPPKYQPPKNSSNNSGWYSWPVIIILFSLGIWPVALALLFFNLFGNSSSRKNQNAASTARKTAYRQAESAVERAMRNAEARADRAAGHAADRTDQAIRRAAAQVERTISRTARQVEQSAKAAPPFEPAKPDKQRKMKQPKIKKSKPAGVLLRLLDRAGSHRQVEVGNLRLENQRLKKQNQALANNLWAKNSQIVRLKMGAPD